jgi:hypothetical protein
MFEPLLDIRSGQEIPGFPRTVNDKILLTLNFRPSHYRAENSNTAAVLATILDYCECTGLLRVHWNCEHTAIIAPRAVLRSWAGSWTGCNTGLLRVP